jgi:hypothetical protein
VGARLGDGGLEDGGSDDGSNEDRGIVQEREERKRPGSTLPFLNSSALYQVFTAFLVCFTRGCMVVISGSWWLFRWWWWLWMWTRGKQ